jgi:hypothetical protein
MGECHYGKEGQQLTVVLFKKKKKKKRKRKVISVSALYTGHTYPAGTFFYQRLRGPQGHDTARRMISMKNSNDTIGNRTRDLPTCSEVPQPTVAPPFPSPLM